MCYIRVHRVRLYSMLVPYRSYMGICVLFWLHVGIWHSTYAAPTEVCHFVTQTEKMGQLSAI